MASSKVQICNWAIAKIGSESFITDLNEDTKYARFLNIVYDGVRDSILRQHLWRFARKRVQLAPLAQTVPFESGNQFQLPSDCLRVVGSSAEYFGGYGRWFTEGDRKLIADTDVFDLVYIASIDDPLAYDSIFTEMFATKLGMEMAILAANSAGLRSILEADYNRLKLQAAHVGSTEQDSMKFISETLIQAHT